VPLTSINSVDNLQECDLWRRGRGRPARIEP
jgi:hypothetical protein